MKLNKKIIKNGVGVLGGIFAYKTIDSYIVVSGWDFQVLGMITLSIFVVSWLVFK